MLYGLSKSNIYDFHGTNRKSYKLTFAVPLHPSPKQWLSPAGLAQPMAPGLPS